VLGIAERDSDNIPRHQDSVRRELDRRRDGVAKSFTTQVEQTQAQIEKAARVAAAHDFIMGMPKGYETVLGESGNSLSGGQRQRLAIARAVLLEPAILLLDDPTAAIDSETEHEIFEALDRAITGRTTFIVAHRLSTLRRADLIIVLDDGRIVQRGTHSELIGVPGPYLHVANLQLVDSRELQEQAGGTKR